MAIYKPSNFTPSLTEIDLNQNNEFSCQVNTSGESVQAYKIQILSGRGDEVVLDGNNNDKNGTNLGRPIKNKGFLKISDSSFDKSKLTNGKDYQWGIRTYTAPIGSQEQPKTLVCSGFLVGSTQYVVWLNIDTDDLKAKEDVNNLLQYDRYIEFKIAKNDISKYVLPFAKGYEEDTEYPPAPNSSDGEYYIQRQKIDWVEKNLGKEKKITKIECEENFDYNFIDGTPFQIYLCSDQHTPNSIYVDPNDIIEPSNYIVIYESKAEYDAAKNDTNNANDPSKGTIRNSARKIYGYSSDTGEIRVQEAFNPVPVNGNYYRIFEYDMVNKTYTEKTGAVEQVIGGKAIEDTYFKVYSNKWSGNGNINNRLFIQPNINIKTDKTNPNEIVFDDGTRLDINQKLDGDEDITFDKLDNTQWLLRGDTISLANGNLLTNPIPKTNYFVYTDFMDSTPYNILYARKTPNLDITYTNLNNPTNTLESLVDSNGNVGYRDILFRASWVYEDNSIPLQDVKYYEYKLYDEDGELIDKSEELYSTELFGSVGNYKTILSWSFKGLETGTSSIYPRRYTIELIVVDEYGKEFYTTKDFGVYYSIETDFIPLTVTIDCDERAINVEANAPVYVKSTDDGSTPTVDANDIVADYLDIPKGEVLNYTTIVAEEEIPIIISENMSLITRFQIKGDFIDSIPIGEELEIIKFASKRYTNKEANKFVIDEYKFTIGSFVTFYINNNKYIRNDNQFKLRWYKNGEILTCWDNNTSDYADLSILCPDFTVVENVQSALQNLEDSGLYIIQFTEADIKTMTTKNAIAKLEQKFKQTYPNVSIGKGIRILLKETYDNNRNDISSKFLSSGVYKYNNGWEPDLSVEYVYVDNLNYLSNIGVTAEDFKIPQDSIGSNGALYWYDGKTDGNGNVDYVWIENNHLNTKNKDTLNKIWFILYFISNNKKENQYTCEIKIEDPNK